MKIIKNENMYTIVIKNDVYDMSENANQPNGYCTFAGRIESFPQIAGKVIEIGDLPKGTLIQLVKILSTYYITEAEL